MSSERKQVFLSAASENRELAELVSSAISDAGYETWTDMESLRHGAEWSASLRDAINVSDFVLIILTKSSIASKWLPYEVGMAQAFAKPIIVLHDGIRVDEIPDYLGDAVVMGISQVHSAISQLSTMLNRA